MSKHHKVAQHKKRSIILLSGGLDSTVSAAIAKKKTKPVFAITYDYGQRAARMEIRASRNIARALKISHKTVSLPFYKNFKNLPLLRSRHKISAKKARNPRDLWIPNRNGVFINVAAAYAEHYNAEIIVTGFNQDEARDFPDNKPQFIASINHSLMYSTLKKIKVTSYVADSTKKQIYKLGKQYKAPLKYIYSCYLGRKEMCGECASCRRLIEAIGKQNGRQRKK